MVFGIETVTTTNLTIRGGPDASGDISLFIGPVYETTKGANLFTTGPISNQTPLFIGLPLSDGGASGSLPIYMNGQPNYGGTSIANPAPIRIVGIPNPTFSTNSTLTMRGPNYVENNTFTTLFITKPAPPEIPQGGSTSPFDVGIISLIGAISISGYSAATKNLSLAIRGDQSSTTNTTLYIETDFNIGKNTSLFVKQTNVTGTTPMFVSGKVTSTNNATLFIKTPSAQTLTLFERGTF